MLFPSVLPPPRAEAALARQESVRQSLDTDKRARQVQRMLLHRLGSFGEAAVRIGPTTDQEHPMLDEHGQELGVHFTQDTPRLGTPGLIDAAMALPQFEEEFDLPPHAPEDEGLPQRQALGGHMVHEEGPARQRQPRGTDLAAFVTGGLPQAPTAGIGDVL